MPQGGIHVLMNASRLDHSYYSYSLVFPSKGVTALMNSYREGYCSFFPGWCYSFPFSRAIGSKVLSKPMISEQASLSAGFFLLWNLVTSFSLGRPWHKKSEGLGGYSSWDPRLGTQKSRSTNGILTRASLVSLVCMPLVTQWAWLLP